MHRDVQQDEHVCPRNQAACVKADCNLQSAAYVQAPQTQTTSHRLSAVVRGCFCAIIKIERGHSRDRVAFKIKTSWKLSTLWLVWVMHAEVGITERGNVALSCLLEDLGIERSPVHGERRCSALRTPVPIIQSKTGESITVPRHRSQDLHSQ